MERWKEEQSFVDAIVEKPSDKAARLVYSDFLLGRGDLRGELIAVQHARDTRPYDADLERRERELIVEVNRDLLKNSPRAAGPATLGFEWRHGFVEAITALRDVWPQELDTCRHHPAFRLVRAVRSSNPHESGVEELIASQPRLSRLELGAPNSSSVLAREVAMAASHGASDLVELVVHNPYPFTSQPVFGPLRETAPKLTSLGLLQAQGPVLREALELPWALTKLVVHVMELEESRSSLEDLAPVLAGTVFPKLRHFELVNASFTNAFLERLATSPLLRRLDTLGISTLTLGVHAFRTLRGDAFAHVKLVPPMTETATMGVFADKLRSHLGERLATARAVPLYEARLRQSPVDLSAAVGLGSALLDLARYEEAIAAFDVGVKNNTGRAADALHGRHLALVALGRLDDAIESLERAVEIDFRNVSFWQTLGDLLDRAGQTDRAQAARKRALEASRSPF